MRFTISSTLFHDTTSPTPGKRILDLKLLTKGLGKMGKVSIPDSI